MLGRSRSVTTPITVVASVTARASAPLMGKGNGGRPATPARNSLPTRRATPLAAWSGEEVATA